MGFEPTEVVNLKHLANARTRPLCDLSTISFIDLSKEQGSSGMLSVHRKQDPLPLRYGESIPNRTVGVKHFFAFSQAHHYVGKSAGNA